MDNVLNVHHYHNTNTNKQYDNDRLAEIAADIEFFNLPEEVLTEKTILSTKDVHVSTLMSGMLMVLSIRNQWKNTLKRKYKRTCHLYSSVDHLSETNQSNFC